MTKMAMRKEVTSKGQQFLENTQNVNEYKDRKEGKLQHRIKLLRKNFF